MIHTFTISKKTNFKRIQKCLEEYAKISKNTEIEKTNEDIICKYHDGHPGLHEVRITRCVDDFGYIYLTLEPRALLKEEYTISLHDPSHQSNQSLKKAFAETIECIFGKLSMRDLRKWYTSRIDYAINIKLPNAGKYTVLAKMGYDPYRYEEGNYTGSSYKKCKSIHLNFYDKQDHIKKKYHQMDCYHRLLQESKDIFRIEVQIRDYNKLAALKKKYSLPDTKIMEFLNHEIAQEVISDYFLKVIKTGDYYSLKEAGKLIDSTKWRQSKKDNIKNWLRLIVQAGSISKAKGAFNVGTKLKGFKTVVKGSDATFNNYLNSCKEINLNPVTIPKEWNIKMLPNPGRCAFIIASSNKEKDE